MKTQKVTLEIIRAKEALIAQLEEQLEKTRKINKVLEDSLEKKNMVKQ